MSERKYDRITEEEKYQLIKNSLGKLTNYDNKFNGERTLLMNLIINLKEDSEIKISGKEYMRLNSNPSQRDDEYFSRQFRKDLLKKINELEGKKNDN